MAKEKTIVEELELRRLWHEAELNNAKDRYQSRKTMALGALDDMKLQIKGDRLYGTEARNLNGYMVDLESARRDVEEAEGKLEVVLSLMRVLEKEGE